ncbi:MAG: SMC-Scp complex subunit ScpB [Phycisphaerales bacterium]|nr:SMC-Scp complex subunit ScpB [Phycisphaerales bacterium]
MHIRDTEVVTDETSPAQESAAVEVTSIDSATTSTTTKALLFEGGDLPCGDLSLTARVEAAILLSDRPISEARLAEVLGFVPMKDCENDAEDGAATAKDSKAIASRRKAAVDAIRTAIDELNQTYAQTNRAFRIESVSGGRQMITLPAYGAIVARLRGVKAQTRLSQAAVETLSIVAYRQPIMRAQLEAIRGVACGEVLKSLMERRLVKITGRAEELGRPMLYGTTPEFLRVFGIASISDLPEAKDLR